MGELELFSIPSTCDENRLEIRLFFNSDEQTFNLESNMETTKFYKYPLIVWIDENDSLDDVIDEILDESYKESILETYKVETNEKRTSVSIIPQKERTSFVPCFDFPIGDFI